MMHLLVYSSGTIFFLWSMTVSISSIDRLIEMFQYFPVQGFLWMSSLLWSTTDLDHFLRVSEAIKVISLEINTIFQSTHISSQVLYENQHNFMRNSEMMDSRARKKTRSIGTWTAIHIIIGELEAIKHITNVWHYFVSLARATELNSNSEKQISNCLLYEMRTWIQLTHIHTHSMSVAFIANFNTAATCSNWFRSRLKQ